MGWETLRSQSSLGNSPVPAYAAARSQSTQPLVTPFKDTDDVDAKPRKLPRLQHRTARELSMSPGMNTGTVGGEAWGSPMRLSGAGGASGGGVSGSKGVLGKTAGMDRQSAVALTQALDARLKKIHKTARQQGNVVALCDEEETYNWCLNEIIGQITDHCYERGALVKRIFNWYVEEPLQQIADARKEAWRRPVEEEMGRMKTECADAAKTVAKAETLVQETKISAAHMNDRMDIAIREKDDTIKSWEKTQAELAIEQAKVQKNQHQIRQLLSKIGNLHQEIRMMQLKIEEAAALHAEDEVKAKRAEQRALKESDRRDEQLAIAASSIEKLQKAITDMHTGTAMRRINDARKMKQMLKEREEMNEQARLDNLVPLECQTDITGGVLSDNAPATETFGIQTDEVEENGFGIAVIVGTNSGDSQLGIGMTVMEEDEDGEEWSSEASDNEASETESILIEEEEDASDGLMAVGDDIHHGSDNSRDDNQTRAVDQTDVSGTTFSGVPLSDCPNCGHRLIIAASGGGAGGDAGSSSGAGTDAKQSSEKTAAVSPTASGESPLETRPEVLPSVPTPSAPPVNPPQTKTLAAPELAELAKLRKEVKGLRRNNKDLKAEAEKRIADVNRDIAPKLPTKAHTSKAALKNKLSIATPVISDPATHTVGVSVECQTSGHHLELLELSEASRAELPLSPGPSRAQLANMPPAGGGGLTLRRSNSTTSLQSLGKFGMGDGVPHTPVGMALHDAGGGFRKDSPKNLSVGFLSSKMTRKGSLASMGGALGAMGMSSTVLLSEGQGIDEEEEEEPMSTKTPQSANQKTWPSPAHVPGVEIETQTDKSYLQKKLAVRKRLQSMANVDEVDQDGNAMEMPPQDEEEEAELAALASVVAETRSAITLTKQVNTQQAVHVADAESEAAKEEEDDIGAYTNDPRLMNKSRLLDRLRETEEKSTGVAMQLTAKIKSLKERDALVIDLRAKVKELESFKEKYITTAAERDKLREAFDALEVRFKEMSEKRKLEKEKERITAKHNHTKVTKLDAQILELVDRVTDFQDRNKVLKESTTKAEWELGRQTELVKTLRDEMAQAKLEHDAALESAARSSFPGGKFKRDGGPKTPKPPRGKGPSPGTPKGAKEQTWSPKSSPKTSTPKGYQPKTSRSPQQSPHVKSPRSSDDDDTHQDHAEGEDGGQSVEEEVEAEEEEEDEGDVFDEAAMEAYAAQLQEEWEKVTVPKEEYEQLEKEMKDLREALEALRTTANDERETAEAALLASTNEIKEMHESHNKQVAELESEIGHLEHVSELYSVTLTKFGVLEDVEQEVTRLTADAALHQSQLEEAAAEAHDGNGVAGSLDAATGGVESQQPAPPRPASPMSNLSSRASTPEMPMLDVTPLLADLFIADQVDIVADPRRAFAAKRFAEPQMPYPELNYMDDDERVALLERMRVPAEGLVVGRRAGDGGPKVKSPRRIAILPPARIVFVDMLDPNCRKHVPQTTDKSAGLKPVAWVLRIIEQVYEEKLLADAADHRCGDAPMRLPTFLFQWMSKKYGLKSLVEQGCWDLQSAVDYYADFHPEVELFRQFLDEEYNPAQLSFLIYCRTFLRNILSERPPAGVSSLTITMAQATEFTWVVFAHLAPERLDMVISMLGTLGDIDDDATVHTMTVQDLLSVLTQEYLLQQLRFRTILHESLSAVDYDRDGWLLREQFMFALKSLLPDWTEHEIRELVQRQMMIPEKISIDDVIALNDVIDIRSLQSPLVKSLVASTKNMYATTEMRTQAAIASHSWSTFSQPLAEKAVAKFVRASRFRAPKTTQSTPA